MRPLLVLAVLAMAPAASASVTVWPQHGPGWVALLIEPGVDGWVEAANPRYFGDSGYGVMMLEATGAHVATFVVHRASERLPVVWAADQTLRVEDHVDPIGYTLGEIGMRLRGAVEIVIVWAGGDVGDWEVRLNSTAAVHAVASGSTTHFLTSRDFDGPGHAGIHASSLGTTTATARANVLDTASIPAVSSLVGVARALHVDPGIHTGFETLQMERAGTTRECGQNHPCLLADVRAHGVPAAFTLTGAAAGLTQTSEVTLSFADVTIPSSWLR